MLFRNITRAAVKAYCSSASSVKTVGHPAKQRLMKLTDTFSSANISEPSTSAKILLGEAIGIKNLDLLSQTIEKTTLSEEQSKQLERMTNCRLANMPLQYIVGNWDFRTIQLKTTPPVFIPRPETEELVGHVLEHLKSLSPPLDKIELLEIGCGSGAICLSLINEYDSSSGATLNIVAVDQSQAACSLTLENAADLHLLSHSTAHSISPPQKEAIAGQEPFCSTFQFYTTKQSPTVGPSKGTCMPNIYFSAI